MAKESIALIKNDLSISSLLSQLNAALAEEWLAHYQYWIGAQVIEGIMRSSVQKEFEEHSKEEAKHAQWIAERIIQLEGVPVLDPTQWTALSRCKYDAPTNPDSVLLLNQNVKAERCAVIRYHEIAEYTHGIDHTTCDLAKRIMAEEEKHEQELQDFLQDIQRIYSSLKMERGIRV